MYLVAHCRTGFEGECARDLERLACSAGSAFTVVPSVPAVVAGTTGDVDIERWRQVLQRRPVIFARSLFTALEPCRFARDRIAPVVAAARTLGPPFSALWLEMPDSNEGKALSPMCRRLQPLLEEALRNAGLLQATPRSLPRLHVLFTARDAAYVGRSDPDVGSPWPMGIPRLRMPHGAPSRSTLKLAEALVTFLGPDEARTLRPGMRAVDLGAAPGGWTWQLAHRGLRVVAVDNGYLRGEIADDPLVAHVRADGLAYRPRRPVDWMVCDMVEKPARIALLVGQWMARGDARHCIFNLKLPMKRRYEEVERCLATIHDTVRQARRRTSAKGRPERERRSAQHEGSPIGLHVRHLYHDRQEVTGYVTLVA